MLFYVTLRYAMLCRPYVMLRYVQYKLALRSIKVNLLRTFLFGCVFFVGTPAEAVVYSETSAESGTEVNLRWRIASPAPIQEYRIRYKTLPEDVWTDRVMLASPSKQTVEDKTRTYALWKSLPDGLHLRGGGGLGLVGLVIFEAEGRYWSVYTMRTLL